MRHFVAVLGATALSISVASAADMPTKAPIVKAPMAAPFTWTGFYIGVNGGWGSSRNVGATTFSNSVGQVFTTTGSTFDGNGGFGGVQAGYNWQAGQIVYGLETDLQFASIKSDIAGGVTGFGDVYNGSRNLNYFGTVRGRVGYAFDRALIYATGGFAYGGLSQSIVSPNAGWNVTAKNDAAGFAVGGGLEYALSPPWSVKGEYQFIDFGSRALTGCYAGCGITLSSNNLSRQYHIVRLGLNYKFMGWR